MGISYILNMHGSICTCALMLACLQRKLACMWLMCSKNLKLTFMMCSWHSIKWTETRGVKMFSTKASRDVGIVFIIK